MPGVQMEHYAGPRDLDSLKEFVILMKAKAAEAADVGNEHVPEYTTEKEYEVHDLFEDEDEDDEDTDAEKPAQV